MVAAYGARHQQRAEQQDHGDNPVDHDSAQPACEPRVAGCEGLHVSLGTHGTARPSFCGHWQSATDIGGRFCGFIPIPAS